MGRDARDADLLGEGTADQGTAEPLSLYEQNQLEERARARRREEDRLARLGRLTSRELGTGGVHRGSAINPRTGKPYSEDPKPGSGGAFGEFFNSIGPTVKAISEDPVTAGVLLAPYGVLGAGAVAGGLVSGGAGTIAGGALPAGTPAMGAPYAMASPFSGTAAGVPATGAPYAMASPFAAGGGGAAAAGGGAAAPAASSAWTTKDTIHAALPFAGSLAMEGISALMRGGDSKEQKALREKQEQLARETELRRQQTQTARMDAMGNRMAAFSPMNQRMAQMLGPEAAFQPSQLAGMVENPMKPTLPPELYDYAGTDPKKLAQINEFMRRREEFKQEEERRKQRVMSGVAPLPAGPSPIQMPTPASARRY